MSPDRKALIFTSPLIMLSLAAAFLNLGIMRISEVRISCSTPSIEKAAIPMKGLSYLSRARLEAEHEIESLGYVESVESRFSKGAFQIMPSYRDDGIIVLSGNDAFVVYPSDTVAVEKRDVPALLSVYPAVEIGKEEFDFFTLFGFDYDYFIREVREESVPSSIQHALDDNVSDMKALQTGLHSGIEGYGVGF